MGAGVGPKQSDVVRISLSCISCIIIIKRPSNMKVVVLLCTLFCMTLCATIVTVQGNLPGGNLSFVVVTLLAFESNNDNQAVEFQIEAGNYSLTETLFNNKIVNVTMVALSSPVISNSLQQTCLSDHIITCSPEGLALDFQSHQGNFQLIGIRITGCAGFNIATSETVSITDCTFDASNGTFTISQAASLTIQNTTFFNNAGKTVHSIILTLCKLLLTLLVSVPFLLWTARSIIYRTTKEQYIGMNNLPRLETVDTILPIVTSPKS